MRKQEWWGISLPHATWQIEQGDALEHLQVQLPLTVKYWEYLIKRQGVRISGNKVWLHLFPPQNTTCEADPDPLDVQYEDDFCLVVNKPPGMNVHPDRPDGRHTLANRVAYHYLLTHQACAIRHIHRLDHDTSGLLLYAKNEWAQLFFDEAMRNRQITRTYSAIVEGKCPSTQGTIREPIGKDRHHAQRRRVSQNGETAITHFRVVDTNSRSTRLELHLETGRTHQIRVHLSHLGCPIVGDSLYGTSHQDITRQALHAEQIAFPHPVTQSIITVHSSMPADMLKLWHKLQNA